MPLYDWPEFQAQTDLIWATIREAARDEGLDLPPDLDHRYQHRSATMEAGLLFSQLCGSPWSRHYSSTASYLASCDFELGDNPSGHYFSQIVVAKGSPWPDLTALARLASARLAFNDDDSQSGVHCLRAILDVEARLASGQETGGHRASMRAVAEGRADFAAIDAFSFTLAERAEPALTDALRVIARTPLRPAPVLVTATSLGPTVGRSMKAAVTHALTSLPTSVVQAYGQRGVVDLGEAAYAVFARDRAARPAPREAQTQTQT